MLAWYALSPWKNYINPPGIETGIYWDDRVNTSIFWCPGPVMVMALENKQLFVFYEDHI